MYSYYCNCNKKFKGGHVSTKLELTNCVSHGICDKCGYYAVKIYDDKLEYKMLSKQDKIIKVTRLSKKGKTLKEIAEILNGTLSGIRTFCVKNNISYNLTHENKRGK